MQSKNKKRESTNTKQAHSQIKSMFKTVEESVGKIKWNFVGETLYSQPCYQGSEYLRHWHTALQVFFKCRKNNLMGLDILYNRIEI